jgi:nicotinate-nucleotide adenylyltransferase
MKTGIMGGSFDPIHMGHLFLAYEALEHFDLDRILFMPSGQGPHKKGIEQTDKWMRLDLVKLATGNEKKFFVSDLEVKRRGYSYTIDSVRELKDNFPMDEFFFITGADAFITLESWKNFEELIHEVHFIAGYRPTVDIKALEDFVVMMVSKYGAKISLLSLIGLEISSSLIRERLARGQHIHYLVPREVERLIKEKNLYGSGTLFSD